MYLLMAHKNCTLINRDMTHVFFSVFFQKTVNRKTLFEGNNHSWIRKEGNNFVISVTRTN